METSQVGSIPADDVYGIIGRLYVQVYTAQQTIESMQRMIKEINARNHTLENALNKRNLENIIKPKVKEQNG